MTNQLIKLEDLPPPPRVRFMHLRFWDTEGEPLAHGGVTVAYRDDPDDATMLNASYSRCHSRDHYNKHIGRSVCLGRLYSQQYYRIPRTDKSPAEAVTEFILDKIYTEDKHHGTAHEEATATGEEDRRLLVCKGVG